MSTSTSNRNQDSDMEDDDLICTDDQDYLEDEFDECGMTPDGYCQLAGTEYCDWECPFSG